MSLKDNIPVDPQRSRLTTASAILCILEPNTAFCPKPWDWAIILEFKKMIICYKSLGSSLNKTAKFILNM